MKPMNRDDVDVIIDSLVADVLLYLAAEADDVVGVNDATYHCIDGIDSVDSVGSVGSEDCQHSVTGIIQ